jgi:hypothetical protein
VGEAGSQTTVLGLAEPPQRPGTRLVEDGDLAQAIVDFLAERKLV